MAVDPKAIGCVNGFVEATSYITIKTTGVFADATDVGNFVFKDGGKFEARKLKLSKNKKKLIIRIKCIEAPPRPIVPGTDSGDWTIVINEAIPVPVTITVDYVEDNPANA